MNLVRHLASGLAVLPFLSQEPRLASDTIRALRSLSDNELQAEQRQTNLAYVDIEL